MELSDLTDLRVRAQDAIATKFYDALLDLSPLLRADTEFWPTYFAPECAIAARASGRDDARAFLDEAISGGFAQFELFPQFVMLFSVDRDWDDLVRACGQRSAAAAGDPELAVARTDAAVGSRRVAGRAGAAIACGLAGTAIERVGDGRGDAGLGDAAVGAGVECDREP